MGDAFHAAFARATDGVVAALDAQRSLWAESWGEIGPLRVRIWEGLEASARAFVRSGRVVGRFFVDPFRDFAVLRFEQRLPPFYRLDADVAYAWDAGWARLRVSAGWINLTLSEEPVGLDCTTGPLERPTEACPVQMAPAVFLPSLGIRAEM